MQVGDLMHTDALHPPHQAGLSFDPHHHESKILVESTFFLVYV